MAGRPQGGLVTAFDASTGHPVAIFADEHYLSDIRTAATGALVADLVARPRWPPPASSAVAVAEDAVRDSDVVITATSATEPLVAAGWLHPGQHLTAVGADDPGKCELEPGVFGRADL